MDRRFERERVCSPCRQNLITGRAVTGQRLASHGAGGLAPIVAPHSEESSMDFIGRPVERF